MAAIPSLSKLKHLYTGKVRDVYEADPAHLLLVTSRRVSAFDVVFPQPIPKKGEVLNLLSGYWFERTRPIVANHLVTTRVADIFSPEAAERETLRGRVALGRKADPIRFECVVRGHLDGSGWREYQKTGMCVGHKLPAGLKRYDKLPEPIFTPATKAETGHDENISVERMASEFGEAETMRLQELSLKLYTFAYEQLVPRGVLLLDTKFEFGYTADGELILIDEAFTPDSSRFRVAGDNGGAPLALDKQYLRDYLEGIGYMGDGEPPRLPEEVIAELSRRYEKAFELISGERLEDALARRG